MSHPLLVFDGETGHLITAVLRPDTVHAGHDALAILQRIVTRLRQQWPGVAKGYAADDGERSPDTRCLAAPILDPSGRAVAALSVSGSAQRCPPDQRQLVLPAVMDAAQRVSLRLG